MAPDAEPDGRIRLTDDDYARAERMLAPYRARHVPPVVPEWRSHDRFTYQLGDRTILVDPTSGSRHAATDAELAGLADDGAALLDQLPSPDGRWTAFRRNGDVWVRTPDGDEVALTDDAGPGLVYGALPDPMSARMALRDSGLDTPPFVAFWSPDSTRLLVHRLDQRGLPETVLVESAPHDGGRPRAHTVRYPMPGDDVPMMIWTVLNVADRRAVPAQAPPEPVMHPADLVYPWWSGQKGEAVLRMRRSRDGRTLDLVRLDPDTGETSVLVTEHGPTRVDPTPELGDPPTTQVLRTGEILWWSQRSGRGQLYLYPADDGDPVPLTPGEPLVRRVLWVDEDRREAVVLVAGLVADDPYVRQIVRVDLEGAGLTRLTHDELDHDAVAPPEGGYLVDRASDVATAPRSRVLDRDGEVLVELETPDTAGLEALGWSPPERFRTTAADDVTPIFGLLWRPHGLDPGRRYPVIDSVYPGPQNYRAGPAFDSLLPGFGEMLAALGFAVVAVDGRGTAGRDKAFHDHAYGAVDRASDLDDHVAAIHELASRYPWIDTGRVGIVGHSAGGYAAARALMSHPDTYSVGVATSGSHDNTVNVALWAEHYHGAPWTTDDAVRALANPALAADLRGHLLLVHGELDDNATPHQMLRLVDALIAADKDVDMLLVPGAGHTFTGRMHYVLKRSIDYLVRHLHHTEPPSYRFAPTPGRP